MTNLNAEDLIRRAEMAERSVGPGGARPFWDELIQRFPNHPRALYLRGRKFVESNDPNTGLQLLSEAERGGAGDANVPLYAALAHRMLGSHEQALAAIDRALAIDPYFFLALLSKGSILERMGQQRVAARVYRNAIKIAPEPSLLPPSQRGAYEHARQVVDGHAQQLANFLRERTRDARAGHSSTDLRRFDESLDILAGVKPRYVADPLLLYYPRLPAIPFFDRSHFPWIEQLEASTDAIREELDVVLREESDQFAPYIQFPAEAPANQWEELNHSTAWSTVFLWRDGVRQDKICAHCPNTMKALESVPLAHQKGFGPTVMFSALDPHTHIPPHTGSTNTRLITHLPLILPPNCRFRVGAETRDWKKGEAWVFDDSIEHEAWNDSDERRIILIFDVWNPLLSDAERELVCEMMTALNEFNAGA